MIQLAWRFLLHQKDSALARWYRARTADARAGTRKTLIVALARKLLVGLWQLATTGKVPEGLVLRPAQDSADAFEPVEMAISALAQDPGSDDEFVPVAWRVEEDRL